MTSPGGNGPIETAFIEIKPQISTQFAADLKRDLIPILKKIGDEAEAAFNGLETATRGASLGVRTVTRSLNSASKAAQNYATHAGQAANASGALGRATSQVNSQMRNLSNSTAAAGRGARNSGTSFNFLTRALVIGAVYEMGHALESLGEFGFKAAAQLEQTKIAFTGLLGSAGAADDYTKKLQDFANKTPFEFEGLAQASQRLIAIGQNGTQAIDTLKIVGNAAAAVGAPAESINRVTLALSQIQAKGKLSSEELNQVAEALPNLDRGAVIENLAKTFGKSTAEIQKLQQKGLIPADAGMQALLQTLEQVPGAMGAMDRQAQTLQGRMSTFKDTIKADFSNALVDSLPLVGDALTTLTGTVSTQIQSIGPALGDAVVGLLPMVEGLVNLLGPLLTDLLANFIPLINQLSPALAPLGEAISTILDALGPALLPIAAAFGQLAVAMAPVAGQIGVSFANALVAVTPLLIMFLNNITSLMNFLMEHQKLLGDITALFITFFGAFKAYVIITKAVAAIKALSIVTFAMTVAQQGLNAALRANPIGAVITVVAALAAGFVLLYRHSETFRKGIDFLKSHLMDAFKFMIGAVIEWATLFITILSKAFGWVPGIGDKLKAAEKAVDGFKDGINNALDKITKRVDIQVVTTYTVADKKEDARLASRQERINKALREAAPGGHINQLSQEEKAAIARHVDQVIQYENAQAKKKKPAKKEPGLFEGKKPSLLPDTAGADAARKKAEAAAKKAAAEAKRHLIKLADASLKAAKKVSDGIKKQLDSATDNLKKLRDQFAEIRDAIRDAFNVDLFETRSAKSFLKRATKNIRKNTELLAQQANLQSRIGGQAGGSDFLKELFESGNRKLIKSLANANNDTLQNVLAKFNENAKLANDIGTAVAGAFQVAGKPLVNGIHDVREEVIRLQKLMVAALAKVEAATKARDRLKAAGGGIFSSATNLQVGEAGREVVVPLTRPQTALDLLLRSGALGLPTVAAHIASLENRANGESMDRLRALVPQSPRFQQPVVKVVKERSVEQTFHIHEAKDPRLTAASVAARTAEHVDR